MVAAGLAGCGGGGGGDEDERGVQLQDGPKTTVEGLAASGSPMTDARIRVIDADGTSSDPAPVAAAADGYYLFDVTNLKAPLLVIAEGLVDGEPATLLAVVPSLSAGSTQTANVSSLTTAVAALVAPGGDVGSLRDPATLGGSATPDRVANAVSVLRTSLSADPQIRRSADPQHDRSGRR